MKKAALLPLLALWLCSVRAEDGYRLWLRYDPIGDNMLLHEYREATRYMQFTAENAILGAARQELITGLGSMLGQTPTGIHDASGEFPEGCLVAGTIAGSPIIARLNWKDSLDSLGSEGYLIRTFTLDGRKATVIAAATDKGVLYGVFAFLRLLQTHRSITRLSISSTPVLALRILDHWYNLDRRAERGYAGISLWDWFTLPDYKDPRYTDYARANASVGINGTVINNVNANPLMLTGEWLDKAAALADIFRPYGIRVYLAVRFSSPVETGGLKTADPLDPAVQQWWRQKVDEIYRLIPDFGGFLVKANSEGQPGPQNYGRTHAEGANMLADALAPHNGIVIWRAFVYSNETPVDRAKQAYNEFKPLDGQFRKNALVQVKNGPIDFQPREPFHPLFGAMPNTPLILEVQLTQEYLGFSNHLVYLAPLFEECLTADTHAQGNGPLVAGTIRGMAGVANIGNDIDWCGHIFAQANWYAYGRLAWDAGKRGSAEIAAEWIRQTFGNEPGLVDSIRQMMMASREIAVDYMTPLGLHHIMGYSHHYGPAPWYDKAPRADWNPVYYHKAETAGVGFDRTASGSNALEQYAPGASAQWADPVGCPDEWLLWFHHVSWDHPMHTGRTLWEELCHRYYTGVDSVRWMQRWWAGLRNRIDPERWEMVDMRLKIQEHDAVWWRNACLLYFQTFSRRQLPPGAEQPDHTLAWYENLKINYAPGTGQ
jgi:alpha-glucuronidase